MRCGPVRSGSAGRSVPSMNQLSRPVWYWSTSCLGVPSLSLWPWRANGDTTAVSGNRMCHARRSEPGDAGPGGAARPRRAAEAARRGAPSRRTPYARGAGGRDRRRAGRAHAQSVPAGSARTTGRCTSPACVLVARRTVYQRASEKLRQLRPPGPPRSAPTDRAGEARPRAA